MQMVINSEIAPTGEAARNHTGTASGSDCLSRELGAEIMASHPLLPAGRKWAIRFDAGGTVTVVLGMKDYGRGWCSSYFAAVAAGCLGIPFGRIRVFYTGTLPAVLQQPALLCSMPRPSGISPTAAVVADLLIKLCGRVIVKAQRAFADQLSAAPTDVGFAPLDGRLFLLDDPRSVGLLDLANTLRNRAPARGALH